MVEMGEVVKTVKVFRLDEKSITSIAVAVAVFTGVIYGILSGLATMLTGSVPGGLLIMVLSPLCSAIGMAIYCSIVLPFINSRLEKSPVYLKLGLGDGVVG